MSVEAIKTQSINMNNPTQNSAVSYPKTEPYPNDTVELSAANKTNKKSKVKKYLMAGCGILAALAGSVILLARHQGNKISKLYENKLVLSNLPEKLEFKEAKTVEEGIKFAKEVLGIKEVDKEFSLEAINIANKGLVDVSNANKGKLFLPPRLRFIDMKENNTLAGVVQDVKANNFGFLYINKIFFDDAVLSQKLNKIFGLGEKNASKTVKKTEEISAKKETKELSRQDLISIEWSERFKELANRFKKSPEQLTVAEKRELYGIYKETNSKFTGVWDRYPLNIIKKQAKLFEDNGIKVSLSDIEKMTTEQQSKKLEELSREYYKKTGRGLYIKSENYVQEGTIYHELGHLQDMAKNLKELDVKQWFLNLKQIWKDAWHKSKTGEDVSRVNVEEVDNRWGSVWEDSYKKLLDDNPKKFKKLYPDLYEFVNNQEIQQTAGEVSDYAQAGIGEFVAEAYRKMIAGENLSEKVKALYQRYKGPELS